MTGRLFPILCVTVALMALTACNPSNTRTAAQTNAPTDLVKAAHDRDEAVDKADSATWDRLTTPDFTLVDDSGRFMSKAERIAEIKASKPAASTNPCQQEQFQVYGSVATRRCRDRNTWWLESWVKSDEGWRVAAIQGTPMQGGGQDAEQEILKMEETANSASLKKDRVALEQLLADDLISLNSNGTATSKAEEIALAEESKWTDAKLTNPKVRIYGNTAVLTGTLTLTGSLKGYVAGPRLITMVWVRRNGRWQTVSEHASLTTKP
jgi:hypothetical protein